MNISPAARLGRAARIPLPKKNALNRSPGHARRRRACPVFSTEVCSTLVEELAREAR
jgi:hypothetical protein